MKPSCNINEWTENLLIENCLGPLLNEKIQVLDGSSPKFVNIHITSAKLVKMVHQEDLLQYHLSLKSINDIIVVFLSVLYYVLST